MDGAKIPVVDLSVERGSHESWKQLCSKVRKACEIHGCFLLKYDKIPSSLREDMVVAMKALFDLPEETKNKYQNPKPYRSYQGKCPVVPLHESFGIDDATRLEGAQQFTHLMWPHGNPAFWYIYSSSTMLLLLFFLVFHASLIFFVWLNWLTS